MTAVVRQLRRTATAQGTPMVYPEPLDYCECNRGPVIGAVIAYADRLQFFPLSNKKAEFPDNVAYLRCVDCVADISMDIANGVIEERMKEMASQRATEMDALMRQNVMRKEAGLPIVPSIPSRDYGWTEGER
ncbi:hypothetical protein [Streptomyces sp. NPDC059802]|uniref:hypothetical protein n=1 Tax=Streptomyces sp. NPDC059802 TaxID=3346952 RepID=UPI0036530CB0